MRIYLPQSQRGEERRGEGAGGGSRQRVNHLDGELSGWTERGRHNEV